MEGFNWQPDLGGSDPKIVIASCFSKISIRVARPLLQ
jgi:hypothetical protein